MKNIINIIVKIQPIPVESLPANLRHYNISPSIINIKNSSLIYSFFEIVNFNLIYFYSNSIISVLI